MNTDEALMDVCFRFRQLKRWNFECRPISGFVYFSLLSKIPFELESKHVHMPIYTDT